jgi:ketosteroid isomerase-like protein
MIAQVIRRLTDALAARDGETVASLVTDDVVYHFPGNNALSGTFRGRDELMAFFRRFPTVLDGPPTADTHDVLSSEAHGADLSTLSATRGGRSHTWRAIRIYHFVDDRISEVFVTIDDQAAFDAFVSA